MIQRNAFSPERACVMLRSQSLEISRTAEKRKNESKAVTHSMGITECEHVKLESTGNYLKLLIMVATN